MAENDPHAGLEFLVTHIIQDFMQFMHQTGLSRHEIHALLHIYHGGEPQISEIGELTGASPAAASQLVDRLVRQGLVERSEDPTNRRIKKLRLTDKSLKIIRQGVTSNHIFGELMTALSPSQQKTVLTAFGYLAQAAEKMATHAGQHTHAMKHALTAPKKATSR